MKIHQRELELSGGRLHYAEAGSGSAIVLIHGGYGCWAHWAANIAPLAEQHRVLAVDLPGFGHSYDPGHCLTPEEQAAVVVEFLGRLGLNNVAVAGFSFGTLVATTLAVRHPALVHSITLVNPPGVGSRSPEALALPARMSALSKDKGKRAGVEGTLRELMLCNHALIDNALIDLLDDSIARTRYITRSLSQQSETLSLFRQVTQRAMVLIGARDPFHNNDLEGRRASIDATLGAETVRIVPDAAHWLQYDRPDYFNRTLLAFTGIASPDATKTRQGAHA